MRISDWSSDVCSSDLQVLGAATSLGAVEADAATLRLTPACCVTSYATFCDWVHDTLIALDSADKDAVVLETFAWLAVEADRQGAAGWINEWTNDAFADAADQALTDRKSTRLNSNH